VRRATEFHPAARAEALAAFDWYLERNRHSAQEFMAELNRVIDRIAENAQLFPRVDQDSRRAVLKRFPYLVVFREIEFRIEIIAVAHGRRRPGYWKSRS
jgi:plasmid stabilization system protein ParE